MDFKFFTSVISLIFSGINLVWYNLEKDPNKKTDRYVAFWALLIISYVCRL